MKIFAIGDLHLPGGSTTKAMNVFGTKWEKHWEKIQEDWNRKVGQNDIVVIPGDLSWGQQMKDAMEDILQIAALPGRKVILKGNHDFWWSSISRLREAMPAGMCAVQNDAVAIDGAVFFGTRGWCKTLKNKQEDVDNEKIFERELGRLKMSLEAAKKLEGKRYGIAHFPPFSDGNTANEFTEIFGESGAEKVIYGHIHGVADGTYDDVRFGNTEYVLTSCDYLNFELKLIDEI